MGAKTRSAGQPLCSQYLCVFDEAEKKGIEQGRTEGLAEGEASGRAAEKLAIAKALKDKGIDIDIISETSGLSKDEIEKL